MDEVLTPPSGQDDLRSLAACLQQAPDGIALAYQLIEQLADRHHLGDAYLVIRPPALGPQIFARGRIPAPTRTVGELLARPSGVYGAANAGLDGGLDGALLGGLGPVVGAAVAGCCELGLAAQLAGLADTSGSDRGLVSRPAIEAALARAASRSARYGWPVTALLVRPLGDGLDPARWRALAVALSSVARLGDEVGDAGAGRAMVVLGNAGPEVVGALVERMQADLARSGIEPGGFDVATVRMPDETVDPEEVWRLAGERLGGPDTTGTVTDWAGSLPTDLELELRRLPGVVAVGTNPGRGEGSAQVTVVAVDPGDDLSCAVVRRVVERFGPDRVAVVTAAVGPSPLRPSANGNDGLLGWPAPNGAGAPPGGGSPADGHAGGNASNGSGRSAAVAALERASAPRVALLTARFDPATGTSEVTVGRGAARASGRASAGPLAGGAQATLAALGVLGIEVPFSLLSVERARNVPGEPVVAVLVPHAVEHRGSGAGTRCGPTERIGVASGTVEVEAASRATLAALNRFLAGQTVTAPAS